eukprot:TRINITY_DN1406_c0_g1_i2.p1 TRINITY_DN1406_c0_g1~~TRINITY_DN1406_c0_g1_i2.p1  ORF type:complete len:160 (+),score=26.96 TRINITY_DN1406_c0_g1_i2:57-536(+)
MATLSTEKFENLKISAACRESKELLAEHYYKTWDDGRTEMVHDESGNLQERCKLWRLYHPNASIVWNGKAMDRDGVNSLVSAMPPSKHTIKTLDVQPTGADGNNFIISVHGICRYQDVVFERFHQQFVIWKDVSNPDQPRHWITYDCLRWLSEGGAEAE